MQSQSGGSIPRMGSQLPVDNGFSSRLHRRGSPALQRRRRSVDTAGPGSERRGPDRPTQVPVQHPNRSWCRSMAVRRHVCRAGTVEPPEVRAHAAARAVPSRLEMITVRRATTAPQSGWGRSAVRVRRRTSRPDERASRYRLLRSTRPSGPSQRTPRIGSPPNDGGRSDLGWRKECSRHGRFCRLPCCRAFRLYRDWVCFSACSSHPRYQRVKPVGLPSGSCRGRNPPSLAVSSPHI